MNLRATHVQLFAALLMGSLAPQLIANAAAIRLVPDGVDDTEQLQAALDSCSGASSTCRIVLGHGVFHTDVLLVRAFHGVIRGQGAGNTIVRPLDGTPLRSTERPFLNDPTLAEPYPVLLHFAGGGDVELRDFTVELPASMTVQSWGLPDPVEDALLAAIMVDGNEDDCARLLMTGVEILATHKNQETSFFSNVMNAVRFEGQLRLPAPGAQSIASRLGQGEFVAHGNYLRGNGNGFALRDTLHTRARIFDNDIQDNTLVGVFLSELGASEITVRGNRIASNELGIWDFRGTRCFDECVQPPPTEPSRYELVDNVININDLGDSPWPGSFPEGILILDFSVFVDPALSGVDTVNIRRNDIVMGIATFDAIFVGGDTGHVTIANNSLWGPTVFGGIGIDSSSGTRTRHNTFTDFGPDAPDVFLGEFTSGVIVNEPNGTVLDLGVDNVIRAGTPFPAP